MRKKLYSLVEKAEKNNSISFFYDWLIMGASILSILPMMFRDVPQEVTEWIETPTVYLLFFDYMLRWFTHDYRRKSTSKWSFVLYPFTPLAIMDLMGILPSLGLLHGSFKAFRLFRLGKLIRYSKSCQRIGNVFKNQKKTLLSVLSIAIAYIFISALIMFVSEPPENFPNFFDALYWATTALTTVGYGDIYPSTQLGKVISMISSIFGVAVIAMPAGIVTAGFLEELNKDFHEGEEKHDEES
ncbi:voltage-gated potassium channel [Aequitasia blattaphilus]|uniref:Ion transporter n=1 Tax=Aequitasia blattaphilus TaxID=2949332 RepID=A0ABT1EA65_9FIRM|nr:ion transporter [Aequitasia blattaphilus]MCP1102713.1 ion transporter [Aequitasia blattaphilus]MCR8615353.1 ion transporter [Aequitasia blattaphilus]